MFGVFVWDCHGWYVLGEWVSAVVSMMSDAADSFEYMNVDLSETLSKAYKTYNCLFNNIA